jgi:hypothetical protein
MLRRLNDGGAHSYSSLMENPDDLKHETPAQELLDKLYELNAIVVE